MLNGIFDLFNIYLNPKKLNVLEMGVAVSVNLILMLVDPNVIDLPLNLFRAAMFRKALS